MGKLKGREFHKIPLGEGDKIEIKRVNSFQMEQSIPIPRFLKTFEKEEFNRWKKLMESYFIMRNIGEDKDAQKVATVNLAGGDELMDLLESLVDPSEELFNKTYTEAKDRNDYNKLILKLSTYFNKVENLVKRCYELRNLKQMRGEKIRDFELRVRSMARKCGHAGDTLENEVTTQLLAGTFDSEIVGKAMEEKFASPGDIVKFGEIREAVREAKQEHEKLHAVADTSASQSSLSRSESWKNNTKSYERKCYSCGSKEHLKRDCPRMRGAGKSRACYNCGNTDHIRKDCPCLSGARETMKRRRSDTPSSGRVSLKKFKEECSAIQEDEMINLVGGGKKLGVTIGGASLTMHVDTGTNSNILGKQGYEMLTLKDAQVWSIEKDPEKLFVTYGSRDNLKPSYSFMAEIHVGEKKGTAKFYVVDIEAANLLGAETAEALGLVTFDVSEKIIFS